jgi:hypothetical protein
LQNIKTGISQRCSQKSWLTDKIVPFSSGSKPIEKSDNHHDPIIHINSGSNGSLS